MTPITSETINWGIIGPGSIATRFAGSLPSVPGAKLYAVGSRSQEKADAFADKFSAPKRYSSYEALAADPDVQVVYIATPHPQHKDAALLCLNHGKSVLLEKPFTVNAKEAAEVIELARAKDLFLMEAMWSRFFPAMVRVRELLAAGTIGEVRMFQGDFGFRAGVNPEGRLFNLALAGGGMMDVGVYPISLASMILGTPTEMTSLAEIGPTGVDEQAAILFKYDGGQLAAITTGIRINTQHEVFILGTEGSLKLHAPWWNLSTLTVNANGKSEEVSVPFDGGGFNYEAQEVQDCLRAGKNESAIMPLDETLSILKTMDTLRGQWGLKYPME
ncbi:MAG: Gfo/Idh/MocA family protein [Janthinobacterium lividum]